MMDFPTLNTFLNGFGHLSKSYSSIQPKVVSSLIQSMPGGSSVPSRTPIHNVSVRLLLLMSQKKKAHLCVCSPWGRKGRAEEGAAAACRQQEPPGPGCARTWSRWGEALGTAWPCPSCLLPPTIWKHSTVFFQPNAKHFTPGNQWWQVDKSFPFAVEGGY